MKHLILASTSRYRRELLERFQLPFTTIDPNVDETPEPGEDAPALANRLARLKAMSSRAVDAVVIGSDQVALRDGRLLGKPGNHAAALAQLESCQGQSVVFHTAVAVLDTATADLQQHTDLTRVRFARRSRLELERYLEQEPAYSCAGGFKAEGLGITLFEAIESNDPTALVGLPLIWLSGALRAAGLDPLRPLQDSQPS